MTGPTTRARPARTRLIRCGAVAAVLYTLIVVIGGFVAVGYDHVAAPVSSLYQTGAANALPIALAFAIYNAFVVAFGIGFGNIARAATEPRRSVGMAAAVALVLVGIAGGLDDIFPQDPIGSVMTTTGTLHIAFAGIASLLTIIAIGLAAAWEWPRRELRRSAWFSVVTVALILAFGPLTAAATAGSWPVMGLLERVTIFSFMVWMAVTSVALSGDPGSWRQRGASSRGRRSMEIAAPS